MNMDDEGNIIDPEEKEKKEKEEKREKLKRREAA